MEDDAYSSLEKYLDAVKKHFSEYAEAEEIISDIESRIADQFSEKAGNEKIVTNEIVEKLIAAMGMPEQFDGEGTEKEKKKSKKIHHEFGARKLYRDSTDIIIAGVCSGIAAYFGNIDPVWVRLAFALSIFFGGFGILLYLILWMIVPLAETNTEKIEMRGEPINIKNLEKTVKNRIDEFKNTDHSKVGKVLDSVFSAFGRILRLLGKIIVIGIRILARVIGFVFVVAAALALAGAVFVAVSIIYNSNSPYIGIPIQDIAAGSDLFVTVISAFFIILFPLIGIIMTGASLLSLRVAFGIKSILILFVLWLISLAVFASFAVKLAPRVENMLENNAYFRTTTKEVEVKDFTKIRMGNADRAAIHQADEYKVIMEGTQKELDAMRVFVENGELISEHSRENGFCIFCAHTGVNFDIYAPKIDSITAGGASKIEIKEHVSEKFDITLSGASRADIAVTSTNATIIVSGASKMTLQGRITNADITMSGASTVSAEKATIENIKATMSGASRINVGNVKDAEFNLTGGSKAFVVSAEKLKKTASEGSGLYIIEERAPTFPLITEF